MCAIYLRKWIACEFFPLSILDKHSESADLHLVWGPNVTWLWQCGRSGNTYAYLKVHQWIVTRLWPWPQQQGCGLRLGTQDSTGLDTFCQTRTRTRWKKTVESRVRPIGWYDVCFDARMSCATKRVSAWQIIFYGLWTRDSDSDSMVNSRTRTRDLDSSQKPCRVHSPAQQTWRDHFLCTRASSQIAGPTSQMKTWRKWWFLTVSVGEIEP